MDNNILMSTAMQPDSDLLNTFYEYVEKAKLDGDISNDEAAVMRIEPVCIIEMMTITKGNKANINKDLILHLKNLLQDDYTNGSNLKAEENQRLYQESKKNYEDTQNRVIKDAVEKAYKKRLNLLKNITKMLIVLIAILFGVSTYLTVKIATRSNESNPWYGKKWYAYGTSMTDASMRGYTARLQQLSGMQLTNYGKGGSGIIPSIHGSDSIKSRCMRMTDGKADADLITVEVIPNDMSGTLGTATDTGDATFCGNLNQIIQYLQTNTSAQIVILIATRDRYDHKNQSITYPPDSDNITQWREWENMVDEVCARNGIICINGAARCGLGYYRMTPSETTYVKDQIHLTPIGANNLASYFWSQLKNIPPFKKDATS